MWGGRLCGEPTNGTEARTARARSLRAAPTIARVSVCAARQQRAAVRGVCGRVRKVVGGQVGFSPGRAIGPGHCSTSEHAANVGPGAARGGAPLPPGCRVQRARSPDIVLRQQIGRTPRAQRAVHRLCVRALQASCQALTTCRRARAIGAAGAPQASTLACRHHAQQQLAGSKRPLPVLAGAACFVRRRPVG